MATLESIEAQITALRSGLIAKFGEMEAKIDAPRSIQSICAHCGGDGQKGAEGETFTCPDCGGDGVRPGGRITLTEDE